MVQLVESVNETNALCHFLGHIRRERGNWVDTEHQQQAPADSM